MKLLGAAAEFVGTFIFLFIILQQGQPIPIAVGLLAAIYAFGNISGGHFNPAVSIMMNFDNQITPLDTCLYIVAQVLGGVCAIFLHKAIKNKNLYLSQQAKTA
jgi:aquaporin Z